ncbi:MAG: hypothetical protein K8S98_09555 [Planctomycetes bacterium]|nr:hypothetical protein [Planctomycetota bacterium]
MLLKGKLEEREKLHGDYFRTTSIAVVVLGACLKFSIEEKIEPRFAAVLPLAGFAFTIVAIVALAMGDHARRSMEADIQVLAAKVEVDIPVQPSMRLKYALMGFLLSDLIFACGFAYVLWHSG